MTGAGMTALWWTARDRPAELGAAVAEAALLLGAGVIGLLSGPSRYRAVRLRDGLPVAADGPVDWAGVYAARLFGADAELRWLHTAGGTGDAVVVAERPAPLPGWTAEHVEVEDVMDGRYALWGHRFEAAPDAPGWCRAHEGRLGHLDLPLDGEVPEPGPVDHGWPVEHLALTYREYVGLDRFGNAEVLDERLTGIRVAGPTTAGQR
jgi:CRISPR-associated protein (TIGR03984 family)